MTGIPASLARALATLRDDPIGILLPAAGLLLLQVLAVMVVRGALDAGIGALAVAVVAVVAARVLLGAPLRSRMIAQAARARGIAVGPWGRPAALLGVHLLTAALVAPPALGVAAAAVLAAAFVAGQGWFTTGAFVLAFGLLVATVLALAVRGVFGLAPPLAVVGGRSAVAAMSGSFRHARAEGLRLFVLLAIGDLLVAVGALLCGAGALPGYPVADLAVLDRWAVMQDG